LLNELYNVQYIYIACFINTSATVYKAKVHLYMYMYVYFRERFSRLKLFTV